MKKIVTACMLGLSLGASALASEAYVFLDASTSMANQQELVKKEAKMLKNELERRGYDVKLFKFGENVSELKSLDGYKAKEDNTNYIELLGHVKKATNKATFVVTDGRVPRKLLDKLDVLNKEIKELEDNGNIVCILSTLRDNAFLKRFGFVVKPVGQAKELVSECLNVWEGLNAKKDKVQRANKEEKKVVKKVEKVVLPDHKSTNIEMVIKIK